MFAGLDWLNDIIQALLNFFPRPVVVPVTHVMMKDKWGKRVIVQPGWRWYWPFTTTFELGITAQRDFDLPAQALTTADGYEVSASGIIIFSISDPEKAYGPKFYDILSIVSSVAQAAIVSSITSWKLKDLHGDMEGIEADLTKTCRTALRRYGVTTVRAALNSFTTNQAFHVTGITLTQQSE